MIPGVETFHARESWQDPRFPVFGPASNMAAVDTAVIHYTAADDLIDGDPGEHASGLPAYLRAMQYSYVTRRGYSLGYMFAVDWLGGVWQIRGWEFKSAANKGHNEHTLPILMLVDGADRATDAALHAARCIIREGERLASRSMAVTGHGQLSGAATACPGVGLRTQIAAGLFSPSLIIDNPPEPPEDEDIMIAYIAKPPASRPGNPPWFLCINGAVRYATSVDAQYAIDNRWAFVELSTEQYDWMHRQVFGS